MKIGTGLRTLLAVVSILTFASLLAAQPFVASGGYYGPPIQLNGSSMMGGFIGFGVNVAQNVVITSVRVRIDVTCPDNSRFGTFIMDPGGTARANFAHWRNGTLSGSNFSNTVFDETAVVSIYDGTGPYNGTFNTGFNELAQFNGLMSGGDWGYSAEYWDNGTCWINSVEIEINNGSVLPVEMTSFVAFGGDKQVTLNWKTESETNNSHFNLYRSTQEGQPGEVFARIDGCGNSATGKSYQYTDTRVQNGRTYYYRIADVAMDGVEKLYPSVVMAIPSANALGGPIPTKYALAQNFPNPFNPSTDITYGISKAGDVRLTIFDALGRQVQTLVNGYQTPNNYRIAFNASTLPSGTYYYTLSTKGFTTTKKMVLTK